ncbi:pyrin-like [Clupea harengus]|uniref:Pyrin-like n=1 Tax=Clupea harengus TaxID=7950 RepID=A0A6P8GPZ8_CLUHA|nr:pyrin-like [Clupea harengus]
MQYNKLNEEKDQLQVQYNNLNEEKDQVEANRNRMIKELETNNNNLRNEKSQLTAKCTTERDELQRRLFKLESMMEIKQHAVNVILDPETAHPKLILSADGKQVRLGDKQQNLPDIPQRFNAGPCVLGKEGFAAGRFYYEVQVRQKMCWSIGVVRESINRKGTIICSTKNGCWIVMMRKNEYIATEAPSVRLSLKKNPQKVGVFVDHEAGLVSFYDADSWSHIHSFTGVSFTDKLFPFLSTCVVVDQIPLIISPVKSYC